MTQRERQASGGVAAVDPPASVQPMPRHSDPPAPLPGGRLPLWEDVYQSASPAQRRELLALAERQGLLYSHQLHTAAENGTERARQLLGRLLAGRLDGLEPLVTEQPPAGDPELDAAQQEAVARALATPDFCLIQGLPGTGRSRVLAAIIAEATLRGERVLFLAPHAAALDRVLTLLAGRESACAVRCLGREETPENLPPGSRALLFEEQVRSLRETTLARGRLEAETAEARCARRRQEASLWTNLREFGERHARVVEHLTSLADAQARIAADVEADLVRVERGEGSDGVSVAAAIQQALRERDEGLAALERREVERAARQAAREQEGQALADELQTLRPLADAKRQGRWWTGAWWRATLQGTASTRAHEIETQLDQARRALDELRQEHEGLAAEKQLLSEKFQAERRRLREIEVARRQAENTDQQAAAREERSLLEEKALSLARAVGRSTPAEVLNREALSAAYASWQQQAHQDDEQAAFSQHWVRCLEELGETLPERLLGYINVVAATTTGLAGDPRYGDSGAVKRPFDLLVLNEAEAITETEFATLARRARRWVLAGEPEGPVAHEEHERAVTGEDLRRSGGRGRGPARARPRAPMLRIGFFHRLWHHLHCDPRRLPYAWVRENDRLCCRLRPVAGDQRRWVETECVADRPDVELRILSVPRHPPQLAEVVFPATTSLAEAKEYIYRELQELPIHTSGHSLRWLEEADRIVLQLADVPLADSVAVPLEAGVRERIGRLPRPGAHPNGPVPNGAPSAGPWYTCCVEFERAAGWQRERARRWIEERLALRDLGRTVRLDRIHRMRPELAACVADLLWGDSIAAAARGDGDAGRAEAALEFVPVPPLPRSRGERGRGRQEAGAPLPRSGAGVELDIADSRHRERLPAELRATMPEGGLANYLEAQAVVRALRGVTGRVAVIALYASQAQLIRRLIAQEDRLRQAAIPVDVPSAFLHQEFDTVLVSLTRSHNHRSVAYGEGPQALALALTRARQRLLVFGDVGNVLRRSQWDGAVDHLDETAGNRERDIFRRLARYLQGQGAFSGFRLHEGSSP